MTVVEPHQKLVHFSLIETLADTMRISSAEVRHSAIVIHDTETVQETPLGL